MTNNYFCTYDLGLAAGLLSSGFEICEITKPEPTRLRFKFENTDELQTAIDDYFLDKLNVSARMMFDNLKMLKNKLFNSRPYEQ